MPTIPIGTRLGPFRDAHQEANFNVFGTSDYKAPPAAIGPGVEQARVISLRRALPASSSERDAKRTAVLFVLLTLLEGR